jgi:hypothetical protein
MSASAKRFNKPADARAFRPDSSIASHSRVTPIASASSSWVTRFPSRCETRAYEPRTRTSRSIRRRRRVRKSASSERGFVVSRSLIVLFMGYPPGRAFRCFQNRLRAMKAGFGTLSERVAARTLDPWPPGPIDTGVALIKAQLSRRLVVPARTTNAGEGFSEGLDSLKFRAKRKRAAAGAAVRRGLRCG